MNDLADIVSAIFAPGKGLLAADESVHTADARLALYGIPTGAEMRRKDRELFLAAPGIEQYLSGVILYDETLRQSADDGTPFGKLLKDRGIMPGIKVDEGTEAFPDSPNEFITKGLLGLPERLKEYHDTFGATFTKWRAVIRIEGGTLPTNAAILENAKRLASYAKLVQEAGMVPIIEPEVLFDGNHSRMRSKEVLQETLSAVFSTLEDQAVDLSGLILKPAMVLSGKDSKRKDTPDEVAEDTVTALIASVPRSVGGIAFLSGGQPPEAAIVNLAAIATRAREQKAPWPLTFSYSRALQEDALKSWAGREENVATARAVYMDKLKEVSAALGAV